MYDDCDNLLLKGLKNTDSKQWKDCHLTALLFERWFISNKLALDQQD